MAEAGECGCALADEEIGSCYCVLEPLVVAVGRRHALPVLNVIAARGAARFNEIQEQLGGLSSSTLAIRLSELENVGLLLRSDVDENGARRSVYSLTGKGKTLRDSLRRLFPKDHS